MLARSANGEEGDDVARTIWISRRPLDVEDNGDEGTLRALDRDGGWWSVSDLRQVVVAVVGEVRAGGSRCRQWLRRGS